MKFTHIRPVCSNTLYAALRDSNHSYNIKHTRSIQINMDKAIKYMQLGLDHLSKVETTFNRMTQMSLSEQEQLNFLKLCYDRPLDEDLKDWRKWNNGIEPIFLDARGKEKSEGTLWHPFNVVTEYEDHWSPVNNPRGQRGAFRSPEVIQEARQVRALLNKSTVDRKTRAFTLADDVQAGRLDLRTGKHNKATRCCSCWCCWTAIIVLSINIMGVIFSQSGDGSLTLNTIMPRHTYLYKSQPDNGDYTCRGGVSGPLGEEDSEYTLEIGNMKNCDPEMLALAAHVDELKHLLSMQAKHEPLSRMVYQSWLNLTNELKNKINENE